MIEPLGTFHSSLTAAAIGDKVNELVEQSNNTERAVEQLCYWLVQAQTGFNLHDAQGIIKILRGETDPEAKR